MVFGKHKVIQALDISKKERAGTLANIANTDELVSSIKTLTQEIDLPTSTFQEKMNAGDINTLFNSIEECFNKLYEKLRLLEDLHDFTERYIQQELERNKKDLDDAILKLDTVADEYTNTRSKAATASFQSGIVVTDRDGTAIDTADMIDGNTAVANSVILSKAYIAQVSTVSTDTAYRRISMPAENYKSFYVETSPRGRKITENIDFLFSQPTKVNFVRLSAFNSEIEKILLIKDSQEEFDTNSTKTGACQTVVARGVRIVLKSGKTNTVFANVTRKKDEFTDPLHIDIEQETDILDTIFETEVRGSGNN